MINIKVLRQIWGVLKFDSNFSTSFLQNGIDFCNGGYAFLGHGSSDYSSQKDFAVPGEVEPSERRARFLIQDDILYFYILLLIKALLCNIHISF